MKRTLIFGLLLALVAIGVVACSSGSPLANAGFEEASTGAFTYLDTASSPLGEGGLKIDLTTGTSGIVNFTVTDESGTETADTYKFTPADGTLLRHRYVAAMGSEYNYYFDYSTMELTKVTDGADEDVTEALKGAGRWDSAATETKEHAEALISYFESTFGMSMSEAIAQ